MTILCDLGSGTLHVLGLSIFIREVLLDDVVRLHVDLLVGVVLAVVDLLHTTTFFNEEGITVDRLTSIVSGFLVHLADLEDVLKTVESNLDDLVVGACEEVAQGLDAAHLNQEANLSRPLKTARSSVGNSPAGLLSGLEISVLEEMDERLDDVRIDDSLDLGGVAGSNVRDGPAGLLTNTILSRAQK